MKRWALSALLFFVAVSLGPAEARKGEPQPRVLLRRLGRTVVAINDRASYQFKGSKSGAVITLTPPVFSERAGAGREPPSPDLMGWLKNLSADLTLSQTLARSVAGYNLPAHLNDRIQMALHSTPAQLQTGETVKAMLTHTSILFPVTLSDPSSLAKNKNYPQWEAAVVKELNDRNLADSLVAVNVFLWGVWTGGAKAEDQSGPSRSGKLPAIASQPGARALLGINTRVISAKNGETLFEDETTYVNSGKSELSAEDLMNNHGKLFERDLDCLLDWYAKNLKSKLAHEALLEEYKCSDRGR
jgi:hypothetical protein